MEGLLRSVFTERGFRRQGPQERNLGRALVAGVLLQVVLEAPELPADPQARRRLLKKRLESTLIDYLAGWVTLDRFRTLVHHLDQWFSLYYPLVNPAGTLREDDQATPLTPSPITRAALRENLLDSWLHYHQGLLPRRPNRKFKRDKLREFLIRTQGGWFRLRDFEQFFHLDRKTAWEYLQKLHRAGLLSHNQSRATAVRYGLAPRFLVVKAEGLRAKVAAALAALHPQLAAQVADWLIATGGLAFREGEFINPLPAGRGPEMVNLLKSSGLLESVGPPGPSQRLRLPRSWLQDDEV